jgi:hypothetical protein
MLEISITWWLVTVGLIVVAVGQCDAVEVERPFRIDLGAARARLLRQLPAGKPQHDQLLHPSPLPSLPGPSPSAC